MHVLSLAGLGAHESQRTLLLLTWLQLGSEPSKAGVVELLPLTRPAMEQPFA